MPQKENIPFPSGCTSGVDRDLDSTCDLNTTKARPLKRNAKELPLSPSSCLLERRRKRALQYGIIIPDDDEHNLPPPPEGKMIGIIYDPTSHNHGDDDVVLGEPCYLMDCGYSTGDSSTESDSDSTGSQSLLDLEAAREKYSRDELREFMPDCMPARDADIQTMMDVYNASNLTNEEAGDLLSTVRHREREMYHSVKQLHKLEWCVESRTSETEEV